MNTINKLNILDNTIDISEAVNLLIENNQRATKENLILLKDKVNETLNYLKLSDNDRFVYRCKNDVQFFIENFVKIKLPNGILSNLNLNNIQLDMLHGFINNNSCRVKCPRQCGSSSLMIAYALWCSLFRVNEKIVYFSSSHAESREVYNKFHYMYINLPDFLKLKLKEHNRTEIKFENDNRINFVSSHINISCMGSINRVFFSEYQFYQEFDKLFQCVYGCLTRDAKTYFISCKNKMFNGTVPACAWVGSYDFTYDKTKDVKWTINMIEQIGIERFKEEYM